MSNELPYELRRLTKMRPEYLDAHDPLLRAANQIEHRDRLLEFTHGEIGEARESFRQLRNHIECGTDLNKETIDWMLAHLDTLYLPKFAEEEKSA